MEFLQRAIDAVFARLRGRGGSSDRDAQTLFQRYGFTIVLCASAVAAARALIFSQRLHDFRDRPIGMAAMESIDAAARTTTFAQCVVLFVLTAALAMWLLPKLERRVGAQAMIVLEALSLTGIALLLLAANRVLSPTAAMVLAIAALLTIALAWLDRVAGRVEIVDRGAHTAWLTATAFATLPLVYDVVGSRMPGGAWVVPGLIGAGALSLELARRLVSAWGSAEDRARASDRFVFALSPLAALAAWSVLQNEIYLLLNHNDVLWIPPRGVGLALAFVLAAWVAVRAVRGPRTNVGERVDVQRVLGRFTFPWIVAGITAMLTFLPTIEPTPDFLEPGNAGLFVQQWNDFGRVPFIETFSAHGLHDSFFGFIYTALNGSGESWALYDYLFGVLGILVAYHVLRALLRSATAAFFCIFALPFIDVLFPWYCSPVAVSVFVVAWVVKQRSALAWSAFTAWTVFVFLWRLDMGFANAIASIGALFATLVLVPEYRPPLSAIVRGVLSAVAILMLVFVALCHARHVDPWGLVLDFKSTVSSNQAFAYPSIAKEKTDIVLMHVFVLPIAVALTLLALFLRLRGKLDLGSKGFFVALACAFFSVYYFANFPRGLVRHSFLERGNTMIASFGFLVLASAPSWFFGEKKRLLAFGAFLFVSGSLCFNFDPISPEKRVTQLRSNRLERTVLGLATFQRTKYSPKRIDRSPAPPWFAPNNTERIVPFLETELARDETFLDLSNSPLLYFHTHRVSPHYQNHTLLVYGDTMQERFLEQLAGFDVPFVVLSMQSELGKKDGPVLHVVLDGVPYALRHYRMHEWVHEHYDPYVTLQRFQVWIRKDRLAKVAPPCTQTTSLVSWKPNERAEAAWTGTDPLLVRIASTEARAVGPRPRLGNEHMAYVRIVGRSDAPSSVQLSWTTLRPNEAPVREERTFATPAGKIERYFTLPGAVEARVLVDLALDAGPGIRIEAVELVAANSSEIYLATQGSQRAGTTDLGDIARFWSAGDRRDTPPTNLRELVGADFETLHAGALVVDREDERFARGVARDHAGLFVDESKIRLPARFAIGDRVLTPHGEWRAIVGLGEVEVDAMGGERRELLLSGGPLTSQADGAPGIVRLSMRAAIAAATTEIREASRVSAGMSRLYAFAPLTEPERRTELVLSLRRATPNPRRVVVAYGLGAEKKGEFVFTLAPDDDVHEYVVRFSVQYNWLRLPCDWLTLTPENGAVDVLGAALRAGD